jgi:environmental stress-induced protein Ves
MRILRRDSYRSVPWKNGQGTTREILRHPAGRADFLWRLSIAEVTQSGPFSAFPGYRRIIMLLRGDGFVLRFNDGREQDLRKPNEPFRFDGGDAVSCVLGGSPSQDLNLMLRANLTAEPCAVVTFSGERRLPPHAAQARLIFCLSAGVTLHLGGKTHEIGEWDTVVFDADETAAAEIVLRSNAPGAFFDAAISA